MFKPKPCKICEKRFTPTAPCNLVCSNECKHSLDNLYKERKRVKSYQRWCEKQKAKGRSFAIGVGRGGTAKRFKDNKLYKNGMGEFARLRLEVKARRFCERCNKDLEHVNNHSWACHHRDHNRNNNVIENLELLCKRCHQLEHECWKAFEGVTTSRKA
jgi:hypothetical protein